MSMKWHVNKDNQVGKCGAQAGRCPFGGASGEENHFSTYEEAAIFSAKKSPEFSDFGTSSKRAPSKAFLNKREAVKKSLVSLGIAKAADLENVSSQREMIQKWFNGDRKYYDSFEVLMRSENLKQTSKKGIAKLLNKGVNVNSINEVSNLTNTSTVDVLDDSVKGLTLEELKAKRPF